MPKIIGQAEQQQAMKDIVAALKKVGVTNEFLGSANPSGEYTLHFTSPDGKKISTSILCPDKSVVDQLAQQFKDNVAKDVAALAEKNRIELDPEEKEIFGLNN